MVDSSPCRTGKSSASSPTRRSFLTVSAVATAATLVPLVAPASAQTVPANDYLAAGTGWLNSPPLTLPSLRGKVVLIDFCTYTCVNWLRTLPYVRAWAEKYKPQGLVVIGVHTPEFSFEKNVDNVRRALKSMRVDYPVVMDSDYAIWRAFNNQYWPALYFIDAQGRIRHYKFGEGEYERSELMIQNLLAESGVKSVGQHRVSLAANGLEAPADRQDLKSGETYVGYERTESFSSPGGAVLDQARAYTIPSRLNLNHWALSGNWTFGKEAISLNKPGGRIAYCFHARDLNLIMAPLGQSAARFRVFLDGQPATTARGSDLGNAASGALAQPRTYQLVRQTKPIVDRRFEIEFIDPGAQAFCFTFG